MWSYGFAYGNRKMKMLEKGVILCSVGNPIERLEQFGLLASMKRVMFGDRLFTAIENSDSGEVSDKTIFSYHQKDNTDGEEGTSIIEEI